jgi:hypothetical protein
MERRKKPAAMFLITSKCFITVSVGIGQAIKCHRLSMKTNIINGSEVSRLSVSIHLKTGDISTLVDHANADNLFLNKYAGKYCLDKSFIEGIFMQGVII